MSTLDIIFDVIGISGVLFILLAYFLLQIERIKSSQLLYSVMNLLGATLLLVSLMWTWNLPSVIIESCWVLISLYGIINVMIKKTKEKRNGGKSV